MAMDKIIGDAQSFVSQFTGVKSTKSHRAQNTKSKQKVRKIKSTKLSSSAADDSLPHA